MAILVRNNPGRSRYELLIDGDLAGVADYSIVEDRVVMPHTEIQQQLRGQGMGAVLVRNALDDLRSSGRTVVPQCWYVAQFIDENPEYRDLVAG